MEKRYRVYAQAISTKSQWLGNYPYDVMTVVERPGKITLVAWNTRPSR